MSDSLIIDSKINSSPGGLMAWLVCLSAGLFFCYEFFQFNLFDVINQSLRNEFKIDATQLSLMSSSFLLANILFLIPAGILLDRFSTRIMILLAIFICLIGTIGFALTHSFLIASFFHFISGIGNAFCFTSCVILVTRWFPPRRQAVVLGCLATMAFLGGMMAHSPFVYLNELYGWRNSLLIDGGIGAVLFLWIFFIVKDRPNEDLGNFATQKQKSSHNFMQALTNPQNWLSGIYISCLNLPIMVIGALWDSSYLQVVHKLSQLTASNIVSLIFFGSILSSPLMGWLSDRIGRRKPLMIFGAIATFFTAIPLIIGIVLPNTMLNIIFFFLGVFTSAQVISYPLVAESNHISNTGAATAISSVIVLGGGGIGQVLFGWLMQHHAGVAIQAYTAADFQFAMWMFPIAAVTALLAILLVRETYCKSTLR